MKQCLRNIVDNMDDNAGAGAWIVDKNAVSIHAEVTR